MEATKVCSLGQITAALFEVGWSIEEICARTTFFCAAKK
jgi:hypothetical protein